MQTLEEKWIIKEVPLVNYILIVSTTIVSWMSQIQNIVALSTTKVEYVLTIEASK